MTGLKPAGLHSILSPVNRPVIMSEARSSLPGSSCQLATPQDPLGPSGAAAEHQKQYLLHTKKLRHMKSD